MTKDTGNWLSAEQAVMPDGTERENLSLINKKLPTLAPLPAGSAPERGDQAEQAPADAGR
ncbi:hypothetical protein [Herbaspirillum sp. alder98]|uniref:hypothetical protein n=1 Tax=Herbaspirillum sp. alder98 TaxID=2913096 RepID=UPI001CD8CE8C|nr:hypothetical protein [Herbaspirillum sp. alder98]MCA1323376.1 hypothetical protein [Herbaspirillum sp. alder98]